METSSGSGVGSVPVAMEDSTMAVNDTGISHSALELQEKLHHLKMKLVRERALLHVSEAPEPEEEELEDAEERAKKVAALTVHRNDTFLNLQGLMMAVQAGQANQTLTKALNLETGGDIQLEEDEEQYVRGLLEEQKELATALAKSSIEENEASMKVIAKQAELAQLYCKYRGLAEKVIGSRKVSQESYDADTKRMQKALKESDKNLNQFRFIVQKFMISQNKFGLQFEDEKINGEFMALLMRCGKAPEEIRAEMMAESSATPPAS